MKLQAQITLPAHSQAQLPPEYNNAPDINPPILGLEDISSQYLRITYNLQEDDQHIQAESNPIDTEPEEEPEEVYEADTEDSYAEYRVALQEVNPDPNPRPLNGSVPSMYFEYTTPSLLDMNLRELEEEFGHNQHALEAQLDLMDPHLQLEQAPPNPLNLILTNSDPPLQQQPEQIEQSPEAPLPDAHLQPLLDNLQPPPDNLGQPQEEQQTLRRSARISVKGFTKNYSPKKSCKKKQTRSEGPTDSEEFQMTILMSLQAEMLELAPLTQVRSDEVDQICGIAISDDLLTIGAGPSHVPLDIEDYGESILGELEFDSSNDKLSEDELVSEDEHH